MHPDRKITLGLVFVFIFLSTFAIAGEKVIFTLKDDRGDDHGDGTLLYPVRDDLEPGDLDLTSLQARAEKNGTTFVATFARPIRPPGYQTIDSQGTTIAHY